MLATMLVCLIVGVSDGDTLTARCPTPDTAHPYQQVKIRLAEIDAPESGQPFGRRSKEYLSSLCFQVQATIRPTAQDRYGRTVARVDCKGTDANLAMVQAGRPGRSRSIKQIRRSRAQNFRHVRLVWGCGRNTTKCRHGSFGIRPRR